MSISSFIREKPCSILLQLSNTPPSDPENTLSGLAKKNNMTYSHTIKLVEGYIEDNLVTREKTGRIVIVSLTKKGKEIAAHLAEIYREMGNPICKK